MVIDTMFVTGIGGSFAFGTISGYAIKKLVRIIAVIVGLGIAALAYLQYKGIIVVNWTQAQNYLTNTSLYVYHQVMNAISQTSGNMHNSVMTTVGIGAGTFIGGFLLGFSRG